MANPTPLRSLVGGLAIPIPVQSLLLLNGNVFGISGFIHRTVKGNWDAAAGLTGLVVGGALVSVLDGLAPDALPLSLSKVVLSGFLVGLGTRLANGCTSGHMICGLSRFSRRSLVATLSFFATGALTAQLLHSDLPAVGFTDLTLGPSGAKYLAAQFVPLGISALTYALGGSRAAVKKGDDQARLAGPPRTVPSRYLRAFTFFNTSVHFALAFHLSNLTSASRVLAFLLLPWHRAFDPSLAFLAAGALPLAIVLYRYGRGDGVPRLGGNWSIPKGGDINLRLVVGSAIFGIGWGIAGICPGPALVNFGRAVAGDANASQYATWLVSMVAGGLAADMA